MAYMTGSLLATVVAGIFLLRYFCVPKFKIDFSYWRQVVAKGIHFYYPALFFMVGAPLGISILSRTASDNNVATFGAVIFIIGPYSRRKAIDLPLWTDYRTKRAASDCGRLKKIRNTKFN